ncbi:TonB-dependent siderophore receptor [Azorhizobium oxalatiphilum]|nr:TonB-dependent siderophore receptor [Azorhizobium oxalatiphilum]
MRALLVSTVLAAAPFAVLPQMAAAQVARPSEIAFNLPAQPLSQALLQFSRVAGVELFLNADLVRGKSSPAVVGSMSREQAMARLLAGSGLTYRFTNNSVSIQAPARGGAVDSGGGILLDTVDVQGAQQTALGPVDGYVALVSMAGTKTDTPLVDVPQSISVVTADQIQDQGAQNLVQALRYTPGVFVEPNGESAHYDDMRIRGFDPLKYLDGMPLPLLQFYGSPRIEVYGLERVEVIKGPASALYGESSPGGLINMISKRPTAETIREIELQTGSFDRIQGAFDVGGAVNDSKTLLVRLTGLARDAGTQVNDTKDERLFLAPSFTLKASEDTTLTVLAQYGRDEGTYPQAFLPAQGTLFPNPYGRLPRSTYLGDPAFDNYSREQWMVGYEFNHRFNDVWSFEQKARYAHVTADVSATRSEGVQSNLFMVDRSAFIMGADAGTFTMTNLARAEFATGALRHEMLFGLDYLRTSGDFNMKVALAPAVNMYAPPVSVPIGPFFNRTDNSQTQTAWGVYVQDQISFDRFILTVSGRQDWASMDTTDWLAETSSSQNDSDFTYRAGLTYKFDNGIAPYISYATSFQPVMGFDADGNGLKPTTGDQIEAGVKYQPPGMDALFTAAVFQIHQDNVVTTDPVTFISSQIGKVEVKGLELEAKGKLNANWEFTAGYSYVDSETTESSNPYEVGRPAPYTPENQGSVWIKYNFTQPQLAGLSVAGGVRYVGSTYSEISSVDPIKVPGYSLVDAAVYYDFGALSTQLQGAKFALNVSNLFDKYYLTYCYGAPYCALGSGRTVLATLSYKW